MDNNRSSSIFVLILFILTIGVLVIGNNHYQNKIKANSTNASIESEKEIKNQEKVTEGKFSGKVWNAIGDSITFRDGYVPLVQKSLNIKEYRNYGKSGYTTEMLVGEIENWDSKADLITFFAGTNDFGRNLDLSITKTSTEKIFSKLTEKYPNKNIVVILPLQRWGYSGDIEPEETMTNSKGITLEQYCDTIAEVAQKYNLEVIDMYNDAGISKDNINDFTVDGLHPNDAGNQKIANVITDFLRNL